MGDNNRREFLKKATLATAAVAAAGTVVAPAVQAAEKKYQWKMVTTWPPHFPVLGEGADKLAEMINKMSGGRLTVQVYGGGELVPALQAFDAVSQGMVEMGHGAAYYWAGKIPAAQFFAAVPFGMNAQGMNAWIYTGGGQELWDELYAPFNLKPMPAGNTGVQMGGWFNREIKSIADFKGLKMRIPGLGGKVLAKAGGTAILSPGGEIYTNLERGVIDATEWVGPYNDYKMGFYKVAKYYYYPGWHEPGTVLETFINKKAYEALPVDLQEIVKRAAEASNLWMLCESETKNPLYLDKLVNEEGVKLRKFPDDVIHALRGYSKEVLDEVVAKDPMSKKVYASFSKFQKQHDAWGEISEVALAEMAK
ncbi:TRAP transporter substrate-binding protein [Geopsychrobacter electrodiphilus]|uniref:TRAP transporter substrate-binding protein n=1 Tax=Geopsychrobacter electrodiphilus TaxID=225196 RepID=UPI00037B20D5|nr:TRAP transporter substrate-binding protein [Geopsychrobacter electrodiphilus]